MIYKEDYVKINGIIHKAITTECENFFAGSYCNITLNDCKYIATYDEWINNYCKKCFIAVRNMWEPGIEVEEIGL